MATRFNEIEVSNQTSLGQLMKLQPVTTRPLNVPEGTIIYRTGAAAGSRKLEYYNGLYWQALEEDVQVLAFSRTATSTTLGTGILALTKFGLNNQAAGNTAVGLAGGSSGPIVETDTNNAGSFYLERVINGTQPYHVEVALNLLNLVAAAANPAISFGYCQVVAATGVYVADSYVPLISIGSSVAASAAFGINADYEIPALAAPAIATNTYALAMQIDSGSYGLRFVAAAGTIPAIDKPLQIIIH